MDQIDFSGALDKELLPLYVWKMEQTEGMAEVIAEVPKTLKEEDFEIIYHDNGIMASAKGKLPFLCGTIIFPVKEFKYFFKDGNIHLQFFKKIEQPWPGIIGGQLCDTIPVDPNTVLSVSISLSIQGQQQESIMLLIGDSVLLFPPAVFVLAQIALEQQIEQLTQIAIKCLKELVSRYELGEACSLIGNYSLLNNGIPLSEGIEYLRKGIAMGDINSCVMLGFILSPYEDPHGPWEDAAEAMRIFKMAEEHPRAKYGIGLLKYFNPSNQEEAEEGKRLVDEARIDLPGMPPIEDLTPTGGIKDSSEEREADPPSAPAKTEAPAAEASDRSALGMRPFIIGASVLAAATCAYMIYKKMYK